MIKTVTFRETIKLFGKHVSAIGAGTGDAARGLTVQVSPPFLLVRSAAHDGLVEDVPLSMVKNILRDEAPVPTPKAPATEEAPKAKKSSKKVNG